MKKLLALVLIMFFVISFVNADGMPVPSSQISMRYYQRQLQVIQEKAQYAYITVNPEIQSEELALFLGLNTIGTTTENQTIIIPFETLPAYVTGKKSDATTFLNDKGFQSIIRLSEKQSFYNATKNEISSLNTIQGIHLLSNGGGALGFLFFIVGGSGSFSTAVSSSFGAVAGAASAEYAGVEYIKSYQFEGALIDFWKAEKGESFRKFVEDIYGQDVPDELVKAIDVYGNHYIAILNIEVKPAVSNNTLTFLKRCLPNTTEEMSNYVRLNPKVSVSYSRGKDPYLSIAEKFYSQAISESESIKVVYPTGQVTQLPNKCGYFCEKDPGHCNTYGWMNETVYVDSCSEVGCYKNCRSFQYEDQGSFIDRDKDGSPDTCGGINVESRCVGTNGAYANVPTINDLSTCSAQNVNQSLYNFFRDMYSPTSKGIELSFGLQLKDNNVYYPLGTGAYWENPIKDTQVIVEIPAANKISLKPQKAAISEDKRYYIWTFIDGNPNFDIKGKIGNADMSTKMSDGLNKFAESIYNHSILYSLLWLLISMIVAWLVAIIITYEFFEGNAWKYLLVAAGTTILSPIFSIWVVTIIGAVVAAFLGGGGFNRRKAKIVVALNACWMIVLLILWGITALLKMYFGA